MADGKRQLPPDLQRWVEARKRFRLSHAHVQMARELGMNPKKLGGLANADQEPWKLPLPQFIEKLYTRRFGKARPDREWCPWKIARRRSRPRRPGSAGRTGPAMRRRPGARRRYPACAAR